MPKTETITWYTQTEVAKIFKANPGTIRKWREKGLIVGEQVGVGKKNPHWRFSDKEVKRRQDALAEEARKKALKKRAKAKVMTVDTDVGKMEIVDAEMLETIVKDAVAKVVSPKELDGFVLRQAFVASVHSAATLRDRTTGKSKASLAIAGAYHISLVELRKAMVVHKAEGRIVLAEVVDDYVNAVYGAKSLFYWDKLVALKADNVKSIQETMDENKVKGGTDDRQNSL